MEWIGLDKSQNRTQFDGEVILGYIDHGKDKRVQFKFRKNSSYKITNGDYVVIAKDGNRIYFKESDKKGFKLGSYCQNARAFKVKEERFPLREEDLGEYNLEFDTELHLHYICLSRKLTKELKFEGRE